MNDKFAFKIDLDHFSTGAKLRQLVWITGFKADFTKGDNYDSLSFNLNSLPGTSDTQIDMELTREFSTNI